jgi:signal transduction histidine kinase
MSHHIQAAKRWKEIEAALLRSQTVAAAGQYAAAIMHEINNPLETICNLSYLLKLEADNPAHVREYSGLIAEQLTTVIHIAHRTLSFYRAPDIKEAIDLASLAEAALRVHQPKLSAKRAKLLKDIPADAVVVGHAGELLQVLSNLLSNSIDALPTNGRLVIRVRKSQGEVHLMVADDGHGIPEAIRRRIFDPFFTTKKDHGTGLGLAVSKAIVERHKGRIRARSSVRSGISGTAFRVSLPLHDDPLERSKEYVEAKRLTRQPA